MASDSGLVPLNEKRRQIYDKLLKQLAEKGFKPKSDSDYSQETLKVIMPDGSIADLGLGYIVMMVGKGTDEDEAIRRGVMTLEDLMAIKTIKIKENMDRLSFKPRLINISWGDYFTQLGGKSRTKSNSPVLYELTDNLHLVLTLEMSNSNHLITVGMCKKEGISIDEIIRACFLNSEKRVHGWMDKDEIKVLKSKSSDILFISAPNKSETPRLLLHLPAMMPVFRRALNSKSERLLMYLPNAEVIVISEMDNREVGPIVKDIFARNPDQLTLWPFILTGSVFEEFPGATKLSPDQIEAFKRCTPLMQKVKEKPSKDNVGKASDAVEAFFKICDIDPVKEYPVQRAYLFRGRLGVLKKEYEKAIEDLTKIETGYIHSSEVMYLLGVAYEGLGQSNKAREYYNRATIFRPRLAEAYYNMAMIDVKAGRQKEAVENLDMVALLQPKSARAFAKRGAVYSESGDKAKAKADFDEALRLDSKNKEAKQGLKKLA